MLIYALEFRLILKATGFLEAEVCQCDVKSNVLPNDRISSSPGEDSVEETCSESRLGIKPRLGIRNYSVSNLTNVVKSWLLPGDNAFQKIGIAHCLQIIQCKVVAAERTRRTRALRNLLNLRTW